MKFTIQPTTYITTVSADVLALFIPESDPDTVIASADIALLDRSLGGVLSSVIRDEHFSGASGKTLSLHSHGKISATHIVLIGVGKKPERMADELITDGAIIAKNAARHHARNVAIVVPTVGPDSQEQLMSLLTEGVLFGNYTFNKHKKKEDEDTKHLFENVIFVVSHEIPQMTVALKEAEAIAQAVCDARDLINEPPSITTPEHLSGIAQGLAKSSKSVSVSVINKKEMESLGMGALLGIAKGATEEPKFIHLTYKGGGSKTVTVVGKGITFDTGGLSLKPPASMETMKLDMSGAAAVLSVFTVLAQLKPKITVHGLISATENMPGPHAVKPGDIVTAMNGKTIEILNTDAEGRVVLADAMSYAAKNIKSDAIIDLATLTGACMVALGEDVAGLFVNDPVLRDALVTSAKRTGERIWELPLVEEYKDLLKSPVADIKNIAKTRYGGAIEGALFIGAFVPENTPWAHLDIAGPAFAEKESPATPLGGTGFGIRLLYDYIRSQSN